MGDTQQEQTTEAAGDVTTDDGAATDAGGETVEEPNSTQNNGGEEAPSSAGADDSSSAAGEGNSDAKQEGTDTADADTEGIQFEDEGDEPMTRPGPDASNAEWAKWRTSQKDDENEDTEDGESGDGETPTAEEIEDMSEEELADLTPEQLKAFEKVVDKKLQPYKEQQAEQQVETEIASFLEENPDFKPFKDKVKRYAMHPSRENIPVESLFYEVAGPKLMQIGAKRQKQAAQEAKKGKTGGGRPTGTEGGSKDWKGMNNDSFGQALEQEKLNARHNS